MSEIAVFGGSSGIGRAVVEACLARGNPVTAIARRTELFSHPRLTWVKADLCIEADRERALRAVEGFRAWVYAAGVVAHQAPGSISQLALDQMLALNFVAALRVGERALTSLAEMGALAFISSTLAAHPVATSAVYSGTKAALTSASKSLALAGAARGIRVNVISPGLVDTDMLAGRDKGALAALVPLGRLGTAQEIATQVLHVIDSPWMTGTNVVIDGGLSLR
jgi:3-oxoacyl-[acyl-carrier protein] reductase